MPKYTRNLIAYLSESDADGALLGDYSITTTLNKSRLPVFHPLLAIARVLQQSNILTPATISIGFNPPNYNNIVNGQQIGGAAGMVVLPLAPGAASVPKNTPLVARISTAAAPVPTTTAILVFRIILLGYDVEF